MTERQERQVKKIVATVCQNYRITPVQLRSQSRARILSDARRTVALMLFKRGFLHKEIAKVLDKTQQSVSKCLGNAVIDQAFERKFYEIDEILKDL